MKTRTGYLIRRGKVFYACWTIAGKKFMQSTHKRDKKEAKTELARIMEPFLVEDEVKTLQNVKARIEGAKAELAVFDEQRNPPVTVAAAWTAYEQAGNRRELGDMTMRIYQLYWSAFTKWLSEAHPEVKALRDVSFPVAEGYWQHMIGTKVTGRTCNAHRAFLRSFFNVLADKAKLPNGNPWAKIAKRDEHSQSRRPLTVEELRRVCRAAEGELRIMLAFGLYLGARLGDASCMDWGSVDMVRRTIRYSPRKTARKNPDPLRIPMHPELYAILSETPPEKRNGPVCPDMARRYTELGTYSVTELVQKHFTDCKIVTTGERNGAGIRRFVSAGFHSLRHSAVSLMREAGAAQSISQAIVGHTSAEVHQLYTHTDEDAMRRAVATLPSMIEETPKALPPAKMIEAAKVTAIAESMTAKTWKAARTELLALAGEADNAR